MWPAEGAVMPLPRAAPLCSRSSLLSPRLYLPLSSHSTPIHLSSARTLCVSISLPANTSATPAREAWHLCAPRNRRASASLLSCFYSERGLPGSDPRAATAYNGAERRREWVYPRRRREKRTAPLASGERCPGRSRCRSSAAPSCSKGTRRTTRRWCTGRGRTAA